MNILYKEVFKKSYFTTIQQITKYGGFCKSNCGVLVCSFWENKKNHSVCTLFTNKIVDGKSLNICNIIYGPDFIGSP